MADNTNTQESYTGGTGIVSSSYLYETLQDFKDTYVDNKVPVVNGKGLSTNDLTNTLKTNYDKAVTNMHTHSNKSVIDTITDSNIKTWNSKSDSTHTHTNYASSVNISGNGNAITNITQSGNVITATKGATFLTSHPTITKTNNSNVTATPAFGGSFTALSGITTDQNGHVTKYETKAITLPSLVFESESLDLSTLT